jgi:tRNA/rRNA methyltransferase
MLRGDELDRVCVVLVRARNPSNIGAVARAMHDFGFSSLRVVNQFPVPLAAAKSAVDASEVMAAAASYASVAEAVADCTLVVGTTAVGERNLQHELLPLAEAAPKLRAELRREPIHDVETVMNGAPGGRDGKGRVALLLGSEKTGLSNDELSHCNWLLTVPMHQHEGVRHPSMNLGQAAAVCLYELVREPLADEKTAANETRHATADPATAAQLELLTSLLTEVMEATEYTRRHAHNCDPAQIRRLVRRMGADAIDAPVWIGILRQTLWKLGLPAEDRHPARDS